MLSSIVCARNFTPFVEESSTRTKGEQQRYVDIRTTKSLGSTPTEHKGASSMVDDTPGLTSTVRSAPLVPMPSSSSAAPSRVEDPKDMDQNHAPLEAGGSAGPRAVRAWANSWQWLQPKHSSRNLRLVS